jgi:3-hydroxyacyl-CoA dehydrogenase/enoyl-CoA hydratase/3-hydroxybutyryl-CoA epimerase
MSSKHIKYSVDTDGIACVTWDVADSPVNIMNEVTMAEFFSTKPSHNRWYKGIIIASAKKFYSRGDLKWFLNYDKSKRNVSIC